MMRGILKSVSGDPIAASVARDRRSSLLAVLDGRVEVVLMLDDPTLPEIERLKEDCGRGYYVVTRVTEPSRTARVLDDVSKERDRQRSLWGDDRGYSPLQWHAVLGEEYGEVSKHVTQGFVPPESDFDRAGYRKELIQTAAVAVAAVEELDEQDRQMRS